MAKTRRSAARKKKQPARVEVKTKRSKARARARRRKTKNNVPVWAFIAVGVIVLLVLALTSGKPRAGEILPATGETLVQGETVYTSTCAACHGENGEGGVGAILSGVPDSHSWHHVDAQLIRMVRDGIPNTEMVGHGEHLSDEEIRAVLGFIKTWWSPEQRAMQRTGQHPMGP